MVHPISKFKKVGSKRNKFGWLGVCVSSKRVYCNDFEVYSQNLSSVTEE